MQALRRGNIGRVGGIVALCAMLLLSFAPAASQWLDAKRVDADLTSRFDPVCASGNANATASAHTDHHAPIHLQACGYCDLIAHAPAPPVPDSARASLRLPRDAFTATDGTRTALAARFRDAQPRAPPSLA